MAEEKPFMQIGANAKQIPVLMKRAVKLEKRISHLSEFQRKLLDNQAKIYEYLGAFGEVRKKAEEVTKAILNENGTYSLIDSNQFNAAVEKLMYEMKKPSEFVNDVYSYKSDEKKPKYEMSKVRVFNIGLFIGIGEGQIISMISEHSMNHLHDAIIAISLGLVLYGFGRLMHDVKFDDKIFEEKDAYVHYMKAKDIIKNAL